MRRCFILRQFSSFGEPDEKVCIFGINRLVGSGFGRGLALRVLAKFFGIRVGFQAMGRRSLAGAASDCIRSGTLVFCRVSDSENNDNSYAQSG
jgi:hypothetical protein